MALACTQEHSLVITAMLKESRPVPVPGRAEQPRAGGVQAPAKGFLDTNFYDLVVPPVKPMGLSGKYGQRTSTNCEVLPRGGAAFFFFLSSRRQENSGSVLRSGVLEVKQIFYSGSSRVIFSSAFLKQGIFSPVPSFEN